MINIINEFNKTNSTLDKREVCKKYKDNKTFIDVFRLANDRAKYTFGVTMKNIQIPTEHNGRISLALAITSLKMDLVTRNVTGNAALQLVASLLQDLNEDDAEVLKLILNRDLRINFGKTEFNKIVSKENKCIKPPYMRCSLMDKISKITYPAMVQVKADGTYRTLVIDNGTAILMGRSGEIDDFPIFQEKVSNLSDGVYIGELLIRSLYGKDNRMKANGLINSDTEQPDMFMECWDYVTLQEFENKLSNIDYIDRYNTLNTHIENSNDLESITTKTVNSYKDAKEFYNECINNGLEGTVLKNTNTPFKDHTSPTQIKMKEEAVSEFFITGYEEGKGRLKGTLGAMFYTSSDNEVQGKMGGFNDEIRKELWENQEKYKGSVVSVKYNGVTKAKGKDTFSLMFANYVDLRPEKDTADDLEYIKNALK